MAIIMIQLYDDSIFQENVNSICGEFYLKMR